MDSKTYQQIVSELKVALAFAEEEWDVFDSVGGKSPFDLVVHKNGILKRVEVKSCAFVDKWNSYRTELRRIRVNKTKKVVYPFDKNSCDILAIYIVPEDKVCFIDPQKLRGVTSLSLKTKKNDNGKAFLIENYLEISVHENNPP